MIEPTNVHPLTDFKRKTTAFRRRLKATGRPELLTVEGRPELVVQDAAAYEKLLDSLDRAEALTGIRRGLRDFAAGRSTDLYEFDREFREKHGLPPRSE